jgi:hypothetical protein
MIKPTKIKIISSLLATSFVLSAFMASVFAPTAHAQTQIVAYPTMEMHATYSVPIYDAAADITASTKSAIAGVGGVSFNTIGKMAMKVFIKVLVQKIVKWIKGGGKGPLFIENFGDVLLEAANQASGLYLEKLKATGLCQNLAPSLMLQIKAQTGPEVSMRCTLRDVINNIDGFSKNFNNGGWKAWLKVSMETQNIWNKKPKRLNYKLR